MVDQSKNIVKIWRLSINKQTFMIKVFLFIWFAAGSTCVTFDILFLKHRGLKIEEVSLMVASSSILQIFLSPISAYIAEKYNKIKTFACTYIGILAITSICLICLPKINQCDTTEVNVTCKNASLKVNTECGFEETNKNLYTCQILTFPAENKTICDSFLKIDLALLNVPLNESNNDECKKTYIFEFKNFSSSVCGSEFYICNMQCQMNVKELSSIASYFIFTMLSIWCLTTTYRFADVLQSIVAEKHNSEFGKHRVWGRVGGIFGPIIAGYVIYYAPLTLARCDDKYVMVHVIMPVLCALCLVALWKLDIEHNDIVPHNHVWIKALTLFKKLDFSILCLILFVLGCATRFDAMFIRWYLEDLGASAKFLGTLKTASSLSAIPILYISKSLITKFGAKSLFIIALFSFAAYEYGNSILAVPWPAFLTNLIKPVYFDLFWVSVIAFTRASSPVELQTTATVFVGIIFFSIGRLTGSLVGGQLVAIYGIRSALKVMAIASLTLGILYLLFTLCIQLKKRVHQIYLLISSVS